MSPRPKKIRHCQGDFCGRAFKPTGTPLSKLDRVELYRDELEALRLCDRDGLTQEEAGQLMGVAGNYSADYHHCQKEGGHGLV